MSEVGVRPGCLLTMWTEDNFQVTHYGIANDNGDNAKDNDKDNDEDKFLQIYI